MGHGLPHIIHCRTAGRLAAARQPVQMLHFKPCPHGYIQSHYRDIHTGGKHLVAGLGIAGHIGLGHRRYISAHGQGTAHHHKALYLMHKPRIFPNGAGYIGQRAKGDDHKLSLILLSQIHVEPAHVHVSCTAAAGR